MICYFDASALVKRYIKEVYTEAVSLLISDAIAATSRLSEAEIASALARRERAGELAQSDCDRLMAAMARDIASLYVVELSAEVSASACRLLMRHKLRAGDALHLASALSVASHADVSVQFIAFDEALNAAARLEGLQLPAF